MSLSVNSHLDIDDEAVTPILSPLDQFADEQKSERAAGQSTSAQTESATDDDQESDLDNEEAESMCSVDARSQFSDDPERAASPPPFHWHNTHLLEELQCCTPFSALLDCLAALVATEDVAAALQQYVFRLTAAVGRPGFKPIYSYFDVEHMREMLRDGAELDSACREVLFTFPAYTRRAADGAEYSLCERCFGTHASRYAARTLILSLKVSRKVREFYNRESEPCNSLVCTKLFASTRVFQPFVICHTCDGFEDPETLRDFPLYVESNLPRECTTCPPGGLEDSLQPKLYCLNCAIRCHFGHRFSFARVLNGTCSCCSSLCKVNAFFDTYKNVLLDLTRLYDTCVLSIYLSIYLIHKIIVLFYHFIILLFYY